MTINGIISDTQTSATYTSIAALSIWAIGSLLGGLTLVSSPTDNLSSPQLTTRYFSKMDADADSYDSITSNLKNESISMILVEEIIGEFYSKILIGQEDFGSEFKNVYFKNAWNLYDN